MRQAVIERHHVTERGEAGPKVVLAHGFGCDQRMWRHVADDLARDHRVVLFDHVGSGRADASAWSPERYDSLNGYRDDVLALLEAVGDEPVVYVGHSISGSIGLMASLVAPERFARLIMVAPNPCFVNDGDYLGGFERSDIMDLLELMERNMLGWANFLAPVAVKSEDRPELVEEMRASLCSGDPAILRQFARVVFLSDIRPLLGHVTVPTLLLQCADDGIAPLAVGDYLAAHIPGATLKRMLATGHCPHLSHPAETVALIRGYLSQAGAD